MEKLIAVVDDEKDILNLITHHLKREGYRVKPFQSGKDFLLYINSVPPDLVLLDIMLPGMDGLELCRILKSKPQTHSIPIIMITAKSTEADIVVGLELGADDYIVKPFRIRELVARVKSILRRYAMKNPGDETLRIGSLSINPASYEVSVDSQKIDLTTTEFKILEALAEAEGKVFTRDQLLKRKTLWGDERVVFDRTIDVHIKNLREKLGSAGKMIKTVRGIGYKLEEIQTV
ncbi:MAG: response regulator transcription factor [Candidatus Dadabacteria bacterium]|nr:response regulator transcription factor [Candidatus Dadabacteria bacterium]MDE0663115.1 response regulator transcription factor [Candidatus Dadabacteria bacterium]